jgi:hypothetical protein
MGTKAIFEREKGHHYRGSNPGHPRDRREYLLLYLASTNVPAKPA